MGSMSFEASLEELRLAWARVKLDRPDRCFVDHPFLVKWVEWDLETWLDGLRAELAAGYVPRPCQLCAAPKAGSLVRPGAVLDIRDETVYNFLVGRFFAGICGVLKGSQGDPDVAYQLATEPDGPQWLEAGCRIWRQWRERSIEKLDQGASYVLVADITGFYDNIDIGKLVSDMRAIDDLGPELELLNDCLRRWATPRSRGIPQGYSASDILAKVYLSSVDSALRNEGFVHLRYVDDFRVFLRSKRDARRSILSLSRLVRGKGLNLQSAKTEILQRDQARTEIDDVTATIENVQEQLVRDMLALRAAGADYIPTSEVFSLLERRSGPPPEVLERTFLEHFSSSGGAKFHTSLFHYLLNRLGAARSLVAAEYCLEALRTRPEETHHVLRYLSRVNIQPSHVRTLVQYMQSPDAIYDYQLYQLVRWFYDHNLHEEVVTMLCRKWLHDHNRDQWLRSYCAAYLGEYGDRSDLENLESSYASLGTQLDKADVVAALRRRERSLRNAFYKRAAPDGELIRTAVALTKGMAQ